VSRSLAWALPAGRRAAEDHPSRPVDPVRAGHEAEDGLGLGVLVGQDEDERFHDLAELGADGPGRLLGGVGRLVENGHFELDALAPGGVEDAPNSGVIDRGWHVPSLASGPGAGTRTPEPGEG
jgi:hypothetical protein